MIDLRVSLWDIGLRSVSVGETTYILKSAPERGASCLVYHAVRQEQVGDEKSSNRVILKEFYPLLSADLGNAFSRQDDGFLCKSDYILQCDEYRLALQRFEKAYKTLLELRSADESAEFLPAPLGWFEGNGTYYRVESYDSGKPLNQLDWTKCFDFSLFMNSFSSYAQTVMKLHDRGYYHLDLKPQNVSLTWDHNIKFFDTDTFVSKSELGEPHVFMESEGYSAPELRSAARHPEDAAYLIGPWTDVYSLAQFICWFLYGKPLRSDELDEQLSQMEEVILRRFDHVEPISPKGLLRLKLFLRKNLNVNYRKRHQDVGDMLYELRSIERFLIPHFGEPNDNFKGVGDPPEDCTEDLQEIEALFGESRALAITGDNKQYREDLARYYAELHRLDYSDIVEVHCNSFRNLIETIQSIPPQIEKKTIEDAADDDSIYRRVKAPVSCDLRNPHFIPMLFLIFDEQERDQLDPEEEKEVERLLAVERCDVMIVGKTDRCWKGIDGLTQKVNTLHLNQHQTVRDAGRKYEFMERHWKTICLSLIAVTATSVILSRFISELAGNILIEQSGQYFKLSSWWNIAWFSFLPWGCAFLGAVGVSMGVSFTHVGRKWNVCASLRDFPLCFMALWSAFLSLFVPEVFRKISSIALSAQKAYISDLSLKVITAMLIVLTILSACLMMVIWMMEIWSEKKYRFTLNLTAVILLLFSLVLMQLQTTAVSWLLPMWGILTVSVYLLTRKMK